MILTLTIFQRQVLLVRALQDKPSDLGEALLRGRLLLGLRKNYPYRETPGRAPGREFFDNVPVYSEEGKLIDRRQGWTRRQAEEATEALHTKETLVELDEEVGKHLIRLIEASFGELDGAAAAELVVLPEQIEDLLAAARLVERKRPEDDALAATKRRGRKKQ